MESSVPLVQKVKAMLSLLFRLEKSKSFDEVALRVFRVPVFSECPQYIEHPFFTLDSVSMVIVRRLIDMYAPCQPCPYEVYRLLVTKPEVLQDSLL
jgi:hypothetical protein